MVTFTLRRLGRGARQATNAVSTASTPKKMAGFAVGDNAPPDAGRPSARFIRSAEMRRLASPGFLAIGQKMKKGPHHQTPFFKFVARPARFELATPWFVVRLSGATR